MQWNAGKCAPYTIGHAVLRVKGLQHPNPSWDTLRTSTCINWAQIFGRIQLVYYKYYLVHLKETMK